MSTERIIHTHMDFKEAGEHSGHPSMASTVRELGKARQKEWEHEQEDLVYYERKAGEVIGDQFQPWDWNEIEIFRSYE